MSAFTKIRVKGVKINTLIPATSLVGLVPPEPQPAGNPVIDIEIEGSPLVIRATLNGKSVRLALKVVAEHGADGVDARCRQSEAAPAEGGPYILDTAGLTVTPKVAKPESSGPSESPAEAAIVAVPFRSCPNPAGSRQSRRRGVRKG